MPLAQGGLSTLTGQLGFGQRIFVQGGEVFNFSLDATATLLDLGGKWGIGHSEVPERYAETADTLNNPQHPWGFQESAFVNGGNSPFDSSPFWSETVVPGWFVPVILPELTEGGLVIATQTALDTIRKTTRSIWDASVRVAQNIDQALKGLNTSALIAGDFGHVLGTAHSAVYGSIDVNIPQDADLLQFNLSVMNSGNGDRLLAAIGNDVLEEVDLASVQSVGGVTVQAWVKDHAGESTSVTLYMPSDVPSSAQFLVSDVKFVTVNFPPVALPEPDSVVIGKSTATFAVTYTDPDGSLLSSTIGSNDILVTGPNGFSQLAALVSLDPPGDSSTRTATYRITAPGTAWTQADAGTYTATMKSQQVGDNSGNYVASGALGAFTVNQYVNQRPSIGSLSASPDPVMQGNTLTLAANNVTDSDGTVVKVEFYRDTNGNGSIDLGTDVLLGTATSGSAGVWTWTGPTSGFPLGMNTYMARAQDDGSAWSTTVTTTGTVNPNSFIGTTGDDTFTFTAGGTWHEVVVTLSGGAPATYRYPASENPNITFNGLGGNDSVTIIGGSGDDTAELYPDHGTLTGSNYSISVSNVESITATSGGGNDQVILHDGPQADTFTATPTGALLIGPGVSLRANGFRSVIANATPGGQDVARLYDATGNDTFTAYPTYALLTNGTTYSSRANDFRFVMAYANQGGTDTATFFDSEGNDTFTSTPTWATMTGKWRPKGAPADRSYYNRGEGFDSYEATSAAGTDLAKLNDSSATDDQYVAEPTWATLSGSGWSSRANNFRYASAYATGGNDAAQLKDSPGTDTFVATPAYGVMYAAASAVNPAYCNRAAGFDQVEAVSASGGDDTARLYDSPGDDNFTAYPTYALLANDMGNPTAYANKATGFRYRPRLCQRRRDRQGVALRLPGQRHLRRLPDLRLLVQHDPGPGVLRSGQLLRPSGRHLQWRRGHSEVL